MSNGSSTGGHFAAVSIQVGRLGGAEQWLNQAWPVVYAHDVFRNPHDSGQNPVRLFSVEEERAADLHVRRRSPSWMTTLLDTHLVEAAVALPIVRKEWHLNRANRSGASKNRTYDLSIIREIDTIRRGPARYQPVPFRPGQRGVR
jgi:hypothetical protein